MAEITPVEVATEVTENYNGKGVKKYPDGSEFHGLFIDGKRTSGLLEMANGESYAGDFEDELFHGYSLYRYKGGDSYCGDFVRGKRHG